MMIQLNREQFRKLAKLVYIGEWIVNSHKSNEEDYEFTDIEQYIYSFFRDFGCEDMLEYDDEHDMYFPTAELDSKMMKYIENFLETNKGDFIGYN